MFNQSSAHAGKRAEEKLVDTSQPRLYRELPAAATAATRAAGPAVPALFAPGFHPVVFRGVSSGPVGLYSQAADMHGDAFGQQQFGLPMEKRASHPELVPSKPALDEIPYVDSFVPKPFGLPAAPTENSTPPLAVGSYLEPHYHFYSRLTGPEIMAKLVSVLQSAPAEGEALDMEVFDHKFKIKAVFYSHGGTVCIPFNVRVFSLEEDERLAVEFQRRSGDPVRFCALYRSCLRRLDADGVSDRVGEAPSPAAAPTFSPPAVLAEPDPQASDHCAQTVKCLLHMMQSDCLDVQREAIGAIAQLALQTDLVMQETLVSRGAVEALVTASRSAQADIYRCAMTGLAHLTGARQDAARLASQVGGVQQAARLCSNSESAPQVQRESMRLIHNVVSFVGSDIYGSEDGDMVRELLQNLDAYPPADASARRQWAVVMERLRV